MKITELDLKENGKKYFCKQANEVFEVEKGNLIPVTRSFSMAELLKLDFEEINEMKNPYTRVERGDKYYSIYGHTILSHTNSNDESDNALCSKANCFNNKNYAEYIDFKETLMRRMDRFAWENNEKVIDWYDCSTKYYIKFEIDIKKFRISRCISFRSNDIYFTSEEIAEKALKKFKDDLIKLYTWKFDF